MYTPPNAYAIGPGLHDEERELYELQENARMAREEAMKKEFYWWKINAYCDRNKDSGKKDIDEKINSALDSIFDNDKEAEKFRHLLFLFQASDEHAHELREFLVNYLMSSYAMEWNYD